MKVHSHWVGIDKEHKSKPYGSADYNAHQPARMQQIQTRVKHRQWFLLPLSTGSMLKGPQLVDLVNITELPLQKKRKFSLFLCINACSIINSKGTYDLA